MLAQFHEEHAASHPPADEPQQEVAETDGRPEAAAGCC